MENQLVRSLFSDKKVIIVCCWWLYMFHAWYVHVLLFYKELNSNKSCICLLHLVVFPKNECNNCHNRKTWAPNFRLLFKIENVIWEFFPLLFHWKKRSDLILFCVRPSVLLLLVKWNTHETFLRAPLLSLRGSSCVWAFQREREEEREREREREAWRKKGHKWSVQLESSNSAYKMCTHMQLMCGRKGRKKVQVNQIYWTKSKLNWTSTNIA